MKTETIIFVLYKQSPRKIIETNFFNYISSEMFFQFGKDRLQHFVAFFSKNLNLFECSYKIYQKELLANMKYFE